MTPWRWWWLEEGDDEHGCWQGECETRDEAIADARRSLPNGKTFFIIEARSSEAREHEESECVPFLRRRNRELLKNIPALEERDMTDWQPIATAPTDGTVIYAKNDVMQHDVKAKFIQKYQCVINGEKIGKPQPAWVVEHDYHEKYMPLLPGTFMSPTMWKPI